MRSPVAKEGWPFIALFALVAGVTDYFCPDPVGDLPLWILTAWCVWFFRDPERRVPGERGAVIAPADGVVVAIEEVEAPLTGERTRKFSIFMNVFNVHVNRSPVAGRVERIVHHPGKFLNAALDKASTENERLEMLLVTDDGVRLPVVQVAGLVARRIVGWVGEGASLERGERYGLIRFGSRVDVYLPLEARVTATLGEKTVAGETVIARWENA